VKNDHFSQVGNGAVANLRESHFPDAHFRRFLVILRVIFDRCRRVGEKVGLGAVFTGFSMILAGLAGPVAKSAKSS